MDFSRFVTLDGVDFRNVQYDGAGGNGNLIVLTGNDPRKRVAPSVWRDGNPGNLAVLASPNTHYAVARAVGILGLGHRAMVPRGCASC